MKTSKPFFKLFLTLNSLLFSFSKIMCLFTWSYFSWTLDLKIVRCILNTWSIFLYLMAAYFIAVASISSSCINVNIWMIMQTWISYRYCMSGPQILPEIINKYLVWRNWSFLPDDHINVTSCLFDILFFSYLLQFVWVYLFVCLYVYTNVSCIPGTCRDQTRRGS